MDDRIRPVKDLWLKKSKVEEQFGMSWWIYATVEQLFTYSDCSPIAWELLQAAWTLLLPEQAIEPRSEASMNKRFFFTSFKLCDSILSYAESEHLLVNVLYDWSPASLTTLGSWIATVLQNMFVQKTRSVFRKKHDNKLFSKRFQLPTPAGQSCLPLHWVHIRQKPYISFCLRALKEWKTYYDDHG